MLLRTRKCVSVPDRSRRAIQYVLRSTLDGGDVVSSDTHTTPSLPIVKASGRSKGSSGSRGSTYRVNAPVARTLTASVTPSPGRAKPGLGA